VRRLTIAAAVIALLLGGCAATSSGRESAPIPASSASATALLARYGLSGDAVAVVEQLEKLGGSERPRELKASVRPNELQLSDADAATSLPMPSDRFYLSVAPYAEDTHECYFHSLTTCQGEMSMRPVHLRIVDSGGRVLVDQETTTNANGFVGTWLPRGSSGTVEITTPQGSGTQPFATGAEDPTCMTTLRLA
jgi:hypothetical protein